MPYDFSKASNAMKIAEQEYASAAEIRFTAFTSCIGVIARKGSELTAVHLVMKARDDTLFDTTAANGALALLPEKPDEVMVFGCISLWENKDNAVDGAFLHLKARLEKMSKYQQYTFAPSSYGAKIDEDGDIEVTY